MPDNYEVYYFGTSDSPMCLEQWLQGLLDDNRELVSFSEGLWVFRKIYPLTVPENEGCKEVHWDCKIAKLEAELARRDEELKITDDLLKEATETIGAVVACCTYNSNDDAKIGIYGIDQKAFTMIDQFITHYNDAVSSGKVSVDVKQ